MDGSVAETPVEWPFQDERGSVARGVRPVLIHSVHSVIGLAPGSLGTTGLAFGFNAASTNGAAHERTAETAEMMDLGARIREVYEMCMKLTEEVYW